jgi:subtilisin family serine protease
MKRFTWSGLALATSAFLVACGGANEVVSTQRAAADTRANTVGALAVTSAPIERSLRRAQGPVDVWVTLDQHALARARALLTETTGVARVRAMSAVRAEPASIRSAMSAQRASILAQQATLSAQLSSLGATSLGSVSVAVNAIAVTVDASRLPDISKLPGVLNVQPVIHYEKHLGDTVPYIGAAAAQIAGVDGTGVTVAVLDSGIDYTHRNLGGSGNVADFATATADPAVIPAGLFPTAKVVGGYDFTGSVWPNGARTSDPNPIDDGPARGHGTHVADIIAGKSLDGTHKGVAPGASLLAVKVCSSVSTSCNGVALLMGMDFALDPNGDGNLDDAADVINLSLGSSYGQIQNTLSAATSNAVALGVVVVASAGNSADRPYITGSPSSSPGVISVAQTQVPSAGAIPLLINAPASIAGVYGNTATVPWAPIGAGVSGDVKTGLQAGGTNNEACTALPAGSLTGKIALIDRGTCNISLKVHNAANAGATGFLLGLVAAGDAVSFSLGDGSNFVPTLVIQQSLASAIKTQLNAGNTVNVSLSPAGQIGLAGSMVGSSSRGPSVSESYIKPEIGAPGASLSADAGSGTGQSEFGGTSGAAPMVSGAAALLLSAYPNRTPMEIKAMLMNSAETTIYTNPAVSPGVLAPITRIGAGEVRVNRALALPAVAWDEQTRSAALSYGALEAEKQTVVERTLTVKNFSASTMRFNVASSFRYANDQASGAVTVQAPTTLNVPANSTRSLKVSLLINPTKLPNWGLNGGSLGGNGAALNGPEYDGYVTLSSGATVLTVPWHVLPRKASLTSAAMGRGGAQLALKNTGADAGAYDMFSLLATSGEIGSAPGAGAGIAQVDLKAFGVRLAGTNLQFAMSTHGRRAHPLYPGGFEVDIDVNGDGLADFFVYQQELTGFAATGQSAVYVQAVGSSTASAFFFTDADLNSGNVIFTVPLSALGVGAGTTLGLELYTYDNYFTGATTEYLGGMKFTPSTPRFAPASGSVAKGGTGAVPLQSQVVSPANSTETGVLLMYRRNAGSESQALTLPIPAAPI